MITAVLLAQDFRHGQTFDEHTILLVKLRERGPQHGIISLTLFVIFIDDIDDIADKLTGHISRGLHPDMGNVLQSVTVSPTLAV